MYNVYILKSETAKKSYVGFTNNLDRRLLEHNSGKNLFTKKYMPWKVVYAEEFETVEEARKKELYFKSTSGRRYLKKMFAEIE